MFLGDFCKHLLGRTSRKFLWCWLLLFYLAGGFSSFIAFQRHSSFFRELSPGFYTHFILSAQLIAQWFATLSFNLSELFVTALPWVLRFWADVFYPHAFFTLHSFPTFWHLFWPRWGQEHPIQDRPLCLPLQNCPFRLTHGLELLIL